jgi:predicted Zn finger-like uncharacterized protein
MHEQQAIQDLVRVVTMSLTTRCIHCQTVFRITLEQLQAHGGQVRCGRCMKVFNGLDVLAPDAAMPAVASAAPTPQRPGSALTADPAPLPAAPPSAQTEAADPVTAVTEKTETEAETETEKELRTGTGAETRHRPGVATDAAPARTEADALPESAHVTEPVDAAEPQTTAAEEQPEVVKVDDDNPFVDEVAAEQPSKLHQPLLAAASVLLAVVLGTQAVYFYRGEIAARHPWARQWIADACVRAGCTVSLPQKPKSVLIEASDLQVVDPAQPSRIQLTATLRNHAGHDVAYPALDLVLTNVNDHTLVRRIFLPAEYLGAGRDPAAGIAANAELTVRLAMETGNLGAAGFRLAVLSAPQQ